MSDLYEDLKNAPEGLKDLIAIRLHEAVEAQSERIQELEAAIREIKEWDIGRYLETGSYIVPISIRKKISELGVSIDDNYWL